MNCYFSITADTETEARYEVKSIDTIRLGALVHQNPGEDFEEADTFIFEANVDDELLSYSEGPIEDYYIGLENVNGGAPIIDFDTML